MPKYRDNSLINSKLCMKHISLVNLKIIYICMFMYYSHCTDGETEACRGEVSCPRTHSEPVAIVYLDLSIPLPNH